jgi:hypothetical protein
MLRLVDSLAVVLSQAYQLARVRLASAASPIFRLLVQRDHAVSEVEMLRRVYRRTPRSRDMLWLVQDTIRACGKPRFLTTDHGTQFRRKFHAALARMKVSHVRGRIRCPSFNGKLERAFRTFRIWWRLVLVGTTLRNLQRRVDSYRLWYNQERPHSAVGGRTPEDAWAGKRLPQAIPIRACDPSKLSMDLHRWHCRCDPWLPVMRITARKAA